MQQKIKQGATGLGKPVPECGQVRPVFLNNGTMGIQIQLEDVVYARSKRNNCVVVMMNGDTHHLPLSLSALEELLDSRTFVRVHRQYIVNVWHVRSFIGNMLCMVNNERLVVGKTFVDDFNRSICILPRLR